MTQSHILFCVLAKYFLTIHFTMYCNVVYSLAIMRSLNINDRPPLHYPPCIAPSLHFPYIAPPPLQNGVERDGSLGQVRGGCWGGGQQVEQAARGHSLTAQSVWAEELSSQGNSDSRHEGWQSGTNIRSVTINERPTCIHVHVHVCAHGSAQNVHVVDIFNKGLHCTLYIVYTCTCTVP